MLIIGLPKILYNQSLSDYVSCIGHRAKRSAINAVRGKQTGLFDNGLFWGFSHLGFLHFIGDFVLFCAGLMLCYSSKRVFVMTLTELSIHQTDAVEEDLDATKFCDPSNESHMPRCRRVAILIYESIEYTTMRVNKWTQIVSAIDATISILLASFYFLHFLLITHLFLNQFHK